MPVSESETSPSAIGRALGIATVFCLVLGFAADPWWFAVSGAFGAFWWSWDFVWDNILVPLGGFLTNAINGAVDVQEPPDLSLDDTIRLLEDHLAADGVTRHVQIQSALRLADIYRLNKKDPARARDVIARARTRWPDAPELQRFETATGDEPAKDA
jgi:hypothetical protein